MGGFWRGYNPAARIIDYQHGNINRNQPGFFENNKAPEHITFNKKEVAVWGEGFKKSFESEEGYYSGKVHVLGYFRSVPDLQYPIVQTNKILFSLQFLPEFGQELNNEMFNHIFAVLKNLESLPHENKPQVVLKNHPRHQNSINTGELISKFDFVSLMAENEILKPSDYSLHVTFYSTLAFEMALEGIPSYFLSTTNFMQGVELFLKEYEYPLSKFTSLQEQWLSYCVDSNAWSLDSDKVKKWGNQFFSPFNRQLFLELIKPVN